MSGNFIGWASGGLFSLAQTKFLLALGKRATVNLMAYCEISMHREKLFNGK